MVLTKAQKKDAVTYLLETVFQLEPDSNIHKAFEHNSLLSPHDLCGLDISIIENLEYPTDTAGNTAVLPKGNIGLLKCFKAYVTYHSLSGSPITDSDWTTLDPDEFDAFRISPISPPPVTATPSRPALPHVDPVREFRRGIKS